MPLRPWWVRRPYQYWGPFAPKDLIQDRASDQPTGQPIGPAGAADLDGFLGTLLVLMQTAQTSMRIRTADTAEVVVFLEAVRPLLGLLTFPVAQHPHQALAVVPAAQKICAFKLCFSFLLSF